MNPFLVSGERTLTLSAEAKNVYGSKHLCNSREGRLCRSTKVIWIVIDWRVVLPLKVVDILEDHFSPPYYSAHLLQHLLQHEDDIDTFLFLPPTLWKPIICQVIFVGKLQFSLPTLQIVAIKWKPTKTLSDFNLSWRCLMFYNH